jgi:ribonuclease-3
MIDRLQRKLNYTFQDISLLQQALTHRSVGAHNNERLEFLGDAILGFEVAEQLYHRVEKASEGELSRMRSQLVKRETLAEIARHLALGDILHLGQGELRSGGQNRDSILSDAVEAIIAAVYLDGGMDAARKLVRHLLAERLQASAQLLRKKDPKTQLQEYLQAQQIDLPVYEVQEVSGDRHQQHFLVSCRVGQLELSSIGRGSSRRKAEQQAAQALLQKLG